MTLTVSQMSRLCGLSRTTLLYYESIGLLKPAGRSRGNYRRYTASQVERLKAICAYRDAGLRPADIRQLLEERSNKASAVLKRRLVELDEEMARLHEHQTAILRLLAAEDGSWRTAKMTKEKWVEIMHAAGMTEEQMRQWHKQFEQQAPDEHQQFLEYLQIAAPEVSKIRTWSREA
ncbi:MAG: MerR family transcriptional regulator [Acidobacteriota bacterium]|nr:MerR family transcriptional regulator [Acidobacteriota bacterium]